MKIQIQMYTMKTKLGQQWLLSGSYVTKDESHNRKKDETKLNYNFNKIQTYKYLFICWKHLTLVSESSPKMASFVQNL
jgi:hypothetical protein